MSPLLLKRVPLLLLLLLMLLVLLLAISARHVLSPTRDLFIESGQDLTEAEHR
jgi:hypothetical protein